MMVENSKETFFSQFEKKFTNFCERSPVYLTFSILHEEVYIKNLTTDSGFVVRLDPSKSPSDNIRHIRNILHEKEYPTLISEKNVFVSPSTESISEEMKKGKTFDEAFKELSSVSEKEYFVVDKINIKKNQVVIENIETKEQIVYQLNMPVILFLKTKLNNSILPEQRYSFLVQEGQKLYTVQRT